MYVVVSTRKGACRLAGTYRRHRGNRSGHPGKAVAARQAKSRQVPPGRPKARVAEVGGVLPHICPMKMIWSIQQAGSEPGNVH